MKNFTNVNRCFLNELMQLGIVNHAHSAAVCSITAHAVGLAKTSNLVYNTK